jgi:hypothetical protein
VRRPVRVHPSPLVANDLPLVNDRRRLLRLRRFGVRRLPRLTWDPLRLRPAVAWGAAICGRVGGCPSRLPMNDRRYHLRLGILLLPTGCPLHLRPTVALTLSAIPGSPQVCR